MLSTLSRLISGGGGKMKAFKVQDVKREARFGIVGTNIADVIKKGKAKLQISDGEVVTVVLKDDGTIVDTDDFLETLPVHTVLVFLKQGENWRGVGASVYEALRKLCFTDQREEIIQEVRDLMTENGSEEIGLFCDYLDSWNTNDILSEKRSDHEDWFEGLHKKYKTKNEVMRNCAQQRLRSYLTSAKDQIDKEKDTNAKALLQEVMEKMKSHLKTNDYHGSYFDRRASLVESICDREGWFRCQGAFDEQTCSKKHNINPYMSKEYRQLFSLWNLDHIVEKSRVVIPTVIQAAKNKPQDREMSWRELYCLLFTRSNLKLVQLSCHKKAARSSDISEESFYV